MTLGEKFKKILSIFLLFTTIFTNFLSFYRVSDEIVFAKDEKNNFVCEFSKEVTLPKDAKVFLKARLIKGQQISVSSKSASKNTGLNENFKFEIAPSTFEISGPGEKSNPNSNPNSIFSYRFYCIFYGIF